MDLVDIDKVLDDLELNEDEKNFPERKASGSGLEKKRYDLESNATNRPTIQAPVSKTFVNITNVFSSLNEYVNVDIDRSVRGPNDTETKQPGSSLEHVSIDAEDIVEGDSTEPSSLSPCHPNKDDYNEFTENKTNEDDGIVSEEEQDIDGLTSASSITTSSPSSFSSGPSPGCSSETGSLISGTDEKSLATKEVPSDKPEPIVNGNSSIKEDMPDALEVSNKDDAGNENNSPEVGLSTISSCLYNENTSSSLPGLSHDLIKMDALSSISSQSPVECEDKDKTNSEPNDEVAAGINTKHPTNLPPQQINSQPQKDGNVIGFGSTMDEISDTELDSILQEIDSDLQSFIPIPDNSIPDTSAETLNESSTSLQPETKRSPCDDEHNLPNADSFSQASTIEFAESRLHSDFGTEVVGVGNADERSTSTNSGTRNEHQQDQTEEEISSQKELSTFSKQLQRPNSLDLPPASSTVSMNINSTAGQTPPASRLDDTSAMSTSSSEEIPQPSITNENPTSSTSVNNNSKLGKIPPFWIPDSEANACMQCKLKFSLLKRRHHCRACGQVLCSMCCSQKAKLEFIGDSEVRICVQCHVILSERTPSDVDVSEEAGTSNRPPNPNNPMEYCSMIPPHQQVAAQNPHTPISVMVPVGVLKREGASKTNRKDKNVIFSDGIRPGCDLTELDNSWDDKGTSASSFRKTGTSKRNQTPPGSAQRSGRNSKPTPTTDETGSYIPEEENALPPMYIKNITDYEYTEVKNNAELIAKLQDETLKFAVQRNLYVFVKIAKLKCCINKTVLNFTTNGMHHVGQDEIVILLEMDNSNILPKDIFVHLNEIYCDADKGHPINELGFSLPKAQNFLDSREHGGFLYIRSTFQCLQEIHLPESPFLIGILIHRWEVPWAKNFPLRLMLRLGAQYRYYPSPHVSIRGRDSVYAEIAQTIINFLADFRNYSYTLATIRGMYIHMEDRKTSVLIPKNRYDQVLKALNNSSDHILALGGNFSKKADGHLVCIQNMESDCQEAHTYSTQAINIQGQPRKVTGASFLVLNGALKSSTGLSGKCSIVEDGLMVQILPAKMTNVRNSLRNMKDIEIRCGPIDADELQTEVVSITWTENDTEFNIGVKSPIDSKKMDGIPSIRVHFGLNCSNISHTIRWTEVFILQSDEESAHGKDPIDISKLSEQIAKSTSTALVSFLDLLVASGCVKIGLRATLHQENVCYEAGSQNMKLAPLYMNALDNELIPTLHRQTTMLELDTPIILELIFHILDK